MMETGGAQRPCWALHGPPGQGWLSCFLSLPITNWSPENTWHTAPLRPAQESLATTTGPEAGLLKSETKSDVMTLAATQTHLEELAHRRPFAGPTAKSQELCGKAGTQASLQ